MLTPEGSHKLCIQSGNGKMFRTTVNVTVKGNSTVTVANCILQQVAKLAYVTGSYDKIEAIIKDYLGYAATELSSLSNLNTLLKYDAIF